MSNSPTPAADAFEPGTPIAAAFAGGLETRRKVMVTCPEFSAHG